MKKILIFSALMFLLIGCKNDASKLKTFVQSGKQTLLEVTDKKGNPWKIHSVLFKDLRTFCVLNKDNEISFMCITAKDSSKKNYYVAFADSSLEQETFEVLDKSFLLNIKNSTESYKKWVSEASIFGRTENSNSKIFRTKKGSLGIGDIKSNGPTIIALWHNAPCHCKQGELGPTCALLLSPQIACVNSLCDFINCIGGTASGAGSSDCSDEASDFRFNCTIAVGGTPN